MPVLAEKAVVTAAAIENRQVGIAIFCLRFLCVLGIAVSRAAWTKPPSNTVGRQTVIVPFQNAIFNCPTAANQTSFGITDKSAKTPVADADHAAVAANSAV
jgi:hypothetical protein